MGLTGQGADRNIYDCNQGCATSCWGKCDSLCAITCSNSCQGSCYSSCSRDCTGKCDNTAMFGDLPLPSDLSKPTPSEPTSTPSEPEQEPENTCAGACSWNCTATCSGGCLDKCYQSCKDGCSGNSEAENKEEEETNTSISSQGKGCNGGCSGQCGKECANSCSFGCDDGCYGSSTNSTQQSGETSNCKNQCAGSCYTSCTGNCKGLGNVEDRTDANNNGIADDYEPAEGTAHLTGEIPEHRGCGVCTSSCSLGCGNSNNKEDEQIEDMAQSFVCDACQGSCVQYCSNCEGKCDGGCFGSCSYFCNQGCSDESKAVPQMKTIMDANNIKEIFEFLVQEAERRNFTSETDWEDTIRMIALTCQIGQTFVDEEALYDSIWDPAKWMIKNEEMQRLFTLRQQKINKNQVNYHSLTDDSIVTSTQLIELLIMPTLDTNAEQTVKINKCKHALLNDILFNRTNLTLTNYKKVKNGSYESILEKEGKLYSLDFLMPKDTEIYSLLMIMYIAYNGQNGFNDRIYQLLSSERTRFYGNKITEINSQLLTNSQITELLTLRKTDSDIVKRNKQILISEYLYYYFAPELFIFNENKKLRSLGMARDDDEVGNSYYHYMQVTHLNNDNTSTIKKYTFPKAFENPADGFIERIPHYYYFVSGSRITDVFRPNGLINEPRAASIKAIENKIKELGGSLDLNESYSGPNANEVYQLKLSLSLSLTLQKFQSDKQKFDWIQDYNNSTRRKHKQELENVSLTTSLLTSIQSINYKLNSNNLKIDDKDPTTNRYFISLENDEKILDSAQLDKQIVDKLYDLQVIAYRMLLYYFQYGGFYFNGNKISNLSSAYPYYIGLKNDYDRGMRSILGTSDGTTTNLGNLTTDAQKGYIKKFYYTTADELEQFFDSSSSSTLYTILMTGTGQINYRSANWSLKGTKRVCAPINQMLFENIHIENTYRDYLKNPSYNLNAMPPNGGRTGFQYEIYSIIMMALVREHGQVIMYAEEKEGQINPNRELFKIVADERIKLLGEKEMSNNLAYDSNLRYSKLLHHNVELTEEQKASATWDGYIQYTPNNSDLPTFFSVTSAYADPDWRKLDFSLLGSYPAPTETIINALSYDFFNEMNKEGYAYINNSDMLAYNKNRLFTDIYCSNFEKINIFTGTPSYCMSVNNTNLILAIKNYDFRNLTDIKTEDKAKEKFLNNYGIQNPIYKEIIYIQYKYDGAVDTSFYLIYDYNGTNFEWMNYEVPNNIKFNNLYTNKLIGKTMTVPYQFDKIGQIGYLNKEIKYIPDSYKEIIDSLDNYGNGMNYITKNNIPMIIEDILVNVFNKDLGESYQSGTISIRPISEIITKTLSKTYDGTNNITQTQYNILKSSGVDVEKYFKVNGADSAGNLLYTMKDSIVVNNTNLESKELVFKHFYETYHQNALYIDKNQANEMSEFGTNDSRSEYAKVFSWYKNPTGELGSQKWIDIATALRDEKIAINETNASSSV